MYDNVSNTSLVAVATVTQKVSHWETSATETFYIIKDFAVGIYLITLRTFPDPLLSWSPATADFTAASK